MSKFRSAYQMWKQWRLADDDITTADIDKLGDLDTTETELEYLDGSTPGTGVAGKAVVLDSSLDFDFGLGDIAATVITADTSVVPDTASGADLGSTDLEWGNAYIGDDKKLYFGDGQDVSIEYDEDGLDVMLVAGDVTFADGTTDVNIASHDGTNGLKLGGTLLTSSAAELNLLDGLTPGTGTASKALVVDSSIDIDLGTGDIGATVITAVTSVVPSVASAADLGTTALEWGDVYIGDDKSLYFGDGQDVSIEYDEDGLNVMLIAGDVTFADGTTDVDIASHDGTNGLRLGGTLLTSSAAELNLLDSVSAGTVSASLAVVAGANKQVDMLFLGSAVPSANALIGGAGAAGTRETSSVANKNFLEYRLENSNAAGDNRGIYNRLYLTGGGGGESLRSFTTVENVAAGTAHGAHLSLNFGATGTVTGLGVAMRATLHIANQGTQSGTLAAIQAEIWSDGTTSDPSGSSLSCFRVVNDGDTGKADVDTDCYLFDFSGWTAGSGSMIYLDVPGTIAGSLRVKIAGTPYYIPLYSAQDD